MGSLAHRLHILLPSEQYVVLDEAADRSGIPIAELIRRAIDTLYMPDPTRKVRIVEHKLGRRPGRPLG